MNSVIEWAGPAADRNYHIGRDGGKVSLIVDHWVGKGTLDEAATYFKNPNSGVSAHFIVGTTGRIVQVVSEVDTAYHAGNFGVNLRSIGIEHECRPDLPPTDALYASSVWLHAKLSADFGFPLSYGTTVVGHRDITQTQCPGSLDWARIVKEANDMYVSLEAYEKYQKDVAATFDALKAIQAKQATEFAALREALHKV